MSYLPGMTASNCRTASWVVRKSPPKIDVLDLPLSQNPIEALLRLAPYTHAPSLQRNKSTFSDISSHLSSTENLHGTDGRSPVYAAAWRLSSLAGAATSGVGGSGKALREEAISAGGDTCSLLVVLVFATGGHFGHSGQRTGGGHSMNSGILS